jgi:thiol-disulfide isomerase/thioredoxin
MRPLIILLAAMLVASCSSEQKPAASGLADFQGQALVINYWAPWCKPCIKEIPELNELAQQHPQIAVLGVNYDGTTGDELQQQIVDLGIHFIVLEQDPAAELGSPRPVVLPTTLIVDNTGNIVHTLTGPQTVASLEQALGLSQATNK